MSLGVDQCLAPSPRGAALGHCTCHWSGVFRCHTRACVVLSRGHLPLVEHHEDKDIDSEVCLSRSTTKSEMSFFCFSRARGVCPTLLTFQGPNQGFTTPPRQSRYKILRCKCLAIEFGSTVEDSVKYAVYLIHMNALITVSIDVHPHTTQHAEQLVQFMESSFPHRRHTPVLGLHTLSRIVHCVLCCLACWTTGGPTVYSAIFSDTRKLSEGGASKNTLPSAASLAVSPLYRLLQFRNRAVSPLLLTSYECSSPERCLPDSH